MEKSLLDRLEEHNQAYQEHQKMALDTNSKITKIHESLYLVKQMDRLKADCRDLDILSQSVEEVKFS